MQAATDNSLDAVFAALSDRTRRSMLTRLAAGSATIGELAEPFDMTLQAVGKHVKVLERAGLVKRHIEGRNHRCALSPVALRDAEKWLDGYLRFWDESLAMLAAHFKR